MRRHCRFPASQHVANHTTSRREKINSSTNITWWTHWEHIACSNNWYFPYVILFATEAHVCADGGELYQNTDRRLHAGAQNNSERGLIPAIDVVPLQPTNIWDNGLAAIWHFGQIHVNIVQKATTFFRTILAFTVQIIVPKPARTETTSDTSYSKTYMMLSTVPSRTHNNNNININIKHQQHEDVSLIQDVQCNFMDDNNWGECSAMCASITSQQGPAVKQRRATIVAWKQQRWCRFGRE